MTTQIKKHSNNKGFSLVELVIVIAIMAVLIAILAPQFIKYVEQSRISADKAVIDEVVRAVNSELATDGTVGPRTLLDTEYEVTFDKGEGSLTKDGSANPLAAAILTLGVDVSTLTLKSSEAANSKIVLDWKFTASDPAKKIYANIWSLEVSGWPDSWGAVPYTPAAVT